MRARARIAALAALVATVSAMAPADGVPPTRAGAVTEPAVGADRGAAAPVGADRAVLARVIEDSGVDSRRPEPSWAAYVAELARRTVSSLLRALRRLARRVGVPVGWVAWIAWALAAVAVVAIVLAVVAVVRQRRRGRPAAAEPAGPRPPEPLGAEVDWRSEIDRRLAAGRIAEALEAAWWWLARALCGERAEASWTGGELVAHGRRPDVAPAVARLDAMTYGPRRPAAADLRGLIERLERRLTADPGAAP